MMNKRHQISALFATHPIKLLVMLAVASLILTHCSSTSNPADQADLQPTKNAITGAQAPASYTDPFAYCAAVGAIDAPDSAYVGPKTPPSIINGLKEAAKLSSDMPETVIESGTVWRCMNGRVSACFVGTNLPCSEKADTSQTPTQPMVDFCQANPATEAIPATVTGRATIYEWQCTDGSPAIVKQIFQPDDQGFISDFWYEIDSNASMPGTSTAP